MPGARAQGISIKAQVLAAAMNLECQAGGIRQIKLLELNRPKRLIQIDSGCDRSRCEAQWPIAVLQRHIAKREIKLGMPGARAAWSRRRKGHFDLPFESPLSESTRDGKVLGEHAQIQSLGGQLRLTRPMLEVLRWLESLMRKSTVDLDRL